MGRAPLPPCVPGLCYVYDGTWEGWLCCVLRSYLDREIPERIVPAGGEEASSLFGCREIRTDEAGAARVRKGMEERLGLPFVRTLQRTFCTCLPAKEWRMLLLTRKAFRYGTGILLYEDEETVHQVHRALTRLGSEIDKWWGSSASAISKASSYRSLGRKTVSCRFWRPILRPVPKRAVPDLRQDTSYGPGPPPRRDGHCAHGRLPHGRPVAGGTAVPAVVEALLRHDRNQTAAQRNVPADTYAKTVLGIPDGIHDDAPCCRRLAKVLQ